MWQSAKAPRRSAIRRFLMPGAGIACADLPAIRTVPQSATLIMPHDDALDQFVPGRSIF